MNITIIGTGYVGLTTGVCFAHIGHTVMCVDINTEKLAQLQAGSCPFYEEGLQELLAETQGAGSIIFTAPCASALANADIVFFCVDTPPGTYGKSDLSHLLAAVKTCAEFAAKPMVYVNKSTAPVGTLAKIERTIREYSPNKDFSVASNPEFLKEGVMVKDFLEPDRIVIGVQDERAKKALMEAYKPITKKGFPLIITTIPSAELIKYTANAFLALKISFINEIADFAERVGADIFEIKKGIAPDSRIGSKFLEAGIGYGGSCFGKDVKALFTTGQEHGYEFKIIKALATVNDMRYQIILKKLTRHLPELQGKTIAVLGLAFKPKTSDVRDAPSHRIIHELLDHGARVRAYDVAANKEFEKNFARAQEITIAPDALEAMHDADALVILTDWNEFKTLDFKKIKSMMRGNLIVDGRNIFERVAAEMHGFIYEGVGR